MACRWFIILTVSVMQLHELLTIEAITFIVLWLLPRLTFATKNSERGLGGNLINNKCHSSDYDPRCESSRARRWCGGKLWRLSFIWLSKCRLENTVCCNRWSTQRTFIIGLTPSITLSLFGPQDDHHRKLERFSPLGVLVQWSLCCCILICTTIGQQATQRCFESRH